MPVAIEHQTIADKFNSIDLENPFALVFSARKGIKSRVFYDFADIIKMSEKKLAGILNLSSRTISNYKEQHKLLEPAQSEHLLKLISLYVRGEQVFGNIEELNYWLNKPFWSSKEKPIDWLVTPGGVDLVILEIDRLSHAYVV